jgi:hypothetical protein
LRPSAHRSRPNDITAWKGTSAARRGRKCGFTSSETPRGHRSEPRGQAARSAGHGGAALPPTGLVDPRAADAAGAITYFVGT